MSWLLPLPVAVPLLTAALVSASDRVAPRRLQDALAIAAAAAATVLSALVLLQTMEHDVVHWFGGWRPDGGVALGIGFTADPLGAGMATLACGLTTLALVYSWTYMREAARLFDVLMLVFCAAMAGFAFTGDIFNMFVWFELMGVAAYALAGFKLEELGPVQGAINFAITNTVGAYLILVGIGLLYARTGALNFAQIGEVLAGHGPDRLVIVALALVVTGFLIKAAIVPFHLWLADAHAVAPAPVCVLFSGAMVELGLYAIARIYWTVFDGTLGAEPAGVENLLIWLGLVTALLGAVMCFLQRHLKRMLAFSTISHAGAILVGIGLLDHTSLAGVADLVLAHGLLKAGLFLLCGIVLLQLRDIDELRLHGLGRRLPLTGILWLLGTVGLVGIPYVGVFLGHDLIDAGAALSHVHWVQSPLMVAEGIAAGALLRAGARLFLGWGPGEDPLLSRQPPEQPAERTASLPLMLSVAGVAIALGLVVSAVPGLQQRSEHGAERFVDRSGYVASVLHGETRRGPAARLPVALEPATSSGIAYGLGATALALGVAAFGLWYRRLPALVVEAGARFATPPVVALRAMHSGIVGDYLLWIAVGGAVIGGVWGLALH
jgi:multicomponent Na+:H+ antiporter subunit D